MSFLALLFWVFASLIVFAYAAYPIVIWLASRCFARAPIAPEQLRENLPFVSVLIVAHDEEQVIEERVQNALAMDYPADRLEIVFALDGCTDRTASIVQSYQSRCVRVLEFPARRGKSATLNDAFEELVGEIVLLSDANTQIDPTAAHRLVRWFRLPDVGVVCGRLVLHDPVTGRNVDSLYWKYETFLKQCEGRLGALLGANGAIYAIRRDLHQPIPNQTVIDDFVVPLLAKLRSGCRIMYDASAVACEETPAAVGSEFRRRARIGAGGFQSIGLLWRLLDPRRGWVALAFLSHKVLRWLCPFFMIGLVVTNLLLVESDFYRWTLLAQVSFYVVSLLASLVPPSIKGFKPLRLATMFTSMNLALFVGFWRWMLGRQRGAWARTCRVSVREEAVPDSTLLRVSQGQ
ncbi:MAG: glycosyltransferase family 2 protein [Isosphaeraceae bacterium]